MQERDLAIMHELVLIPQSFGYSLVVQVCHTLAPCDDQKVGCRGINLS